MSPNLVKVTESISGPVVPLAMFLIILNQVAIGINVSINRNVNGYYFMPVTPRLFLDKKNWSERGRPGQVGVSLTEVDL